jgi:hypothetical protein
MNGAVALLVLLAGSGLAPVTRADDGRVVIKNLAVGLICGPEADRRVCFRTSDIQVTGEGRCQYDGRTEPCTWYGYSFDYRLPGDSVTLQCEAASSTPFSVGTAGGQVLKGVSKARFELTLGHDSSHFVNPQYVAASHEAKGTVAEIWQTCAYAGRTLFDVMIRLHFPEQ